MKANMFRYALMAGLVMAASALAAADSDKATTTSAPATQKALTAMDVVRHANYVAYYQGADGRADVQMTIVGKDGSKQTRDLTILRRDEPSPKEKDVDNLTPAQRKAIDEANQGRQYFYVYFHRPSSIRNMSYLVHKYTDKDDDRWLYLPALDNVNRIAGRDKRTSFVGSHFLYEDVSGRNINADTHKLLQTTKDYYVIESKPKKPDEVEFSSYKTWIMRSNFLPVQVIYYDKEGKPYRKGRVLKWDRVGKEKYPTVMQAVMSDSKMGGYTVMQYSKVKYNIGLPADIFSERYLRRPPRKYLED